MAAEKRLIPALVLSVILAACGEDRVPAAASQPGAPAAASSLAAAPVPASPLAPASAAMSAPQSGPATQAMAATQPQSVTRAGIATSGEWKIEKGVVEQLSAESPALLLFGDRTWTDYTIELEGQKTSGDEGFLIGVRAHDPRNLVWFNVGGWGNTRSAFEFANGDEGKTDFGEQQTYGEFLEVVTDKWHKLKVVVAGNKAEGFMDGKTVCVFDAPSLKDGGVALGTWATQARFRNIKVTSRDGKVLWEGAPSHLFTTIGGDWQLTAKEAEQNGADTPALLTLGEGTWKNYVVELEAQKTGGDEGFLIAVRMHDQDNLVWLNVGGWGNTRTAFEFAQGEAGKTDFGDQQTYQAFQEVVTGKWHELKVVADGNKIEGFMDGKSVCMFDAASLPDGRVALGTWSTQAKFRNVKITDLSGKTLWEGFKASE